jgi:hypothetical protein
MTATDMFLAANSNSLAVLGANADAPTQVVHSADVGAEKLILARAGVTTTELGRSL